ncbi:MAG: Flp pilus assembly complex ATPase component TadA [Candidatus Omnitrophica bacterium]|nr:Flp pilus assembly complex ATPase component TadA [Candidatus Omnitrophota bacterium]
MLNKQKIVSDYLVAKGIIGVLELKQALEEQFSAQERIELILKRYNVFDEEQLGELIVQELGLTVVEFSVLEFRREVLGLINPSFANRFRVFPVHFIEDVLIVAIDTPLNVLSLGYFSSVLKIKLETVIIRAKQMNELLEEYYPISGTALVNRSGTDNEANSLTPEEEAPVIQLVSMLISDAYRKRASDIHVEPMYDTLKIRYRIDGLLREVQSPGKKLQAALISRIKLMAGMNIAEKRLPQDGRIRTVVDNKEFDLRISTLPSHHGESVVLRILDKRVMHVEELGFSDQQQQMFKEIIGLPNGIILVTGPTGSGKSTTLYAVLSSIDRARKKILTVEDPVEYQINGINQVQVKSKIGLSFARVLRSMLRQAPDIIMVGEIRDIETARIAVQSALTGHLIFSTLHTNDAPSAITRLVDMGIQPYLVGATLQAVLAQRLIRLLCPKCRQEYHPPKDEMRILEWVDSKKEIVLYRAKGCNFCSHTGYLGRTGIFELLIINDKIRQLMHEYVPSTVIREHAREMGMVTLKDHARRKVLDGVTTFQELVRVTQNDID